MNCTRDVAALLAKITTRNGALPQGSPCSPILAYYAYIDMWEGIAKIAKNAGYRFSAYIDDITISGEKILEQDIWDIKKLIYANGHKISLHKERTIFQNSVEVTSVVIVDGNLLVPNRQYKKLHDIQHESAKAKKKEDKEMLEPKIRGYKAQANQILNHSNEN